MASLDSKGRSDTIDCGAGNDFVYKDSGYVAPLWLAAKTSRLPVPYRPGLLKMRMATRGPTMAPSQTIAPTLPTLPRQMQTEMA